MDDYLRTHAAFIAQVRDGNKSAIDALTAHQQLCDVLYASLANYAPLASPALSGTPTAPTATAGTNTTQIATTKFVQQASALSLPAGSLIYYAGYVPPAGYLKANGALLSRTTYAALFAAIGIIYSAGDGSTNFGLPDLRGEFIRGWDNGRGIDAGRLIGSWQGEFRLERIFQSIKLQSR